MIAICGAALVGMSIYGKRAISGKWRAVGDSFGYGRQVGAAHPAPAGSVWEEEEGAIPWEWKGTWVWSGGDIYSGTWSHAPDGRIGTAVLKITKSETGEVTVIRTNCAPDASDCDCEYRGTIAADGKTVTGRYTCDHSCGNRNWAGACQWRATIR